MKFRVALNEDRKIECDDCGARMMYKHNPGLADADEYVCPKCGNKQIVGWPKPEYKENSSDH